MSNKIKIKPLSKPLTASELLHRRELEAGKSVCGFDQPDLQKLIQLRRAEPKKSMAFGVYDDAESAVYIEDQAFFDYSMQNHGYYRNKKHYLIYYEAIYAMQTGRLELNFHDMPMSLEQAYVLLMGEQRSDKYDILMVYSHLGRHGFLVKAHCNIDYKPANGSYNKADCCWETNMRMCNNKSLPDSVESSEDFDAGLMSVQMGESCLDCFADLHKFLADYQYIELNNSNTIKADLYITFDIFLKDTAYVNMSMRPPVLRVVVLASDKLFPTHDDIEAAFEQQKYKTPLLLVQVAAGKQMQCFLYRIPNKP